MGDGSPRYTDANSNRDGFNFLKNSGFPYDEFANCEPENVFEGVRCGCCGNGSVGGDFGGSSS